MTFALIGNGFILHCLFYLLLIQRSFNKLLESEGRPRCAHYCIAGGDKALLQSIEAPEDSWLEGKQALEEVGGSVGGTHKSQYRLTANVVGNDEKKVLFLL